MKEEEKQKKEETDRLNGGEKTRSTSLTKLVLINVVFFLVVAGGIMFASGHSVFDLLGYTYWAAKSKEEGL